MGLNGDGEMRGREKPAQRFIAATRLRGRPCVLTCVRVCVCVCVMELQLHRPPLISITCKQCRDAGTHCTWGPSESS